MAGNSKETNSTQNRPKLDATGEFFSVGAPLHAVRAGYVKRRADELLYDTVVSGRFAHVLAPDRSGKSSLVAATAARLENNGYRVAILDLAQSSDRDGTDSGRWYYSVAYRLLRQLRIRFELQAWWQDKSFLNNRQRLLEFYSEILLQRVEQPIVVFVDEIQCIENLPYATQLLTSIRAAHNARTTDPDFLRLSFVLLGECDPVSLIEEAELSPFQVTQPVALGDFSRSDLDVFLTEINLPPAAASEALDRIFYWSNGQPYLSQKLGRAVSRDTPTGDVSDFVDRIALQQLAGRAALHSEPHMSHIHRAIANAGKDSEGLLTLYGKLRKGIDVAADLGSSLQRRLMAVGLVTISEEGKLQVRNRLYEAVFTARWANENLPVRLRVPVIATAVLVLIAMIPFWYTQWLPGPYVRLLASDDAELSVANEAYQNLRSFPGHAGTAENMYRQFLQRRASTATSVDEIGDVAKLAAELPNSGRLADELEAGYWDREVDAALRDENRDDALLASIQALAMATAKRRKKVAMLVGDDYPMLLATLPGPAGETTVFDPFGKVLTSATGAAIVQRSFAPQGIQEREPWTLTALEVSPLLRRVIVDREGVVSRVGLTLNLSHARLADLRIKVIAPSGRAVEIVPGRESASSGDDIRIPSRQLRELKGESLNGTWSVSVRDETLGVAGQLVGWTLELNSQGAVEYFQRGLNIPDPVEREADDVWFDRAGRYAVARAPRSDNVRIWDLAFAEPVRAIAVTENEALIGLSSDARRLVTATQESVNLWDAVTGNRVATLPVGAASIDSVLTADGSNLFVQRRSDTETRLELWSLEQQRRVAEVTVAGVPALVAVDAAGSRVAIADFDRAVRVWDFSSKQLLGQFDLPAQPSEISLSADGQSLGAVYANAGLSLWRVDRAQSPLLNLSGSGSWRLVFSPSGNVVAAGRSESGFQVYNSSDGRLTGPALGMQQGGHATDLLTFSQDEQLLLAGGRDTAVRFWRTPPATPESTQQAPGAHTIWSPSGDRTTRVAADGRFAAIGDRTGHVHIVAADAQPGDVAELGNDVSFLGHSREIHLLQTDQSGTLVASAAMDNSVRVWRSQNGEPLPYSINVVGAPISQLSFSPDAMFLAVLSANRLIVANSADGTTLAEFDFSAPHHGMTFSADGQLYLGGDDGTLKRVAQAGSGGWQIQQVWSGTTPIRLLSAAPRGDTLILVDQNNLASQFVLSEGQIADETLQLPSDVEEVVFSANGTDAYFRSLRWVHRVSSSASGLHWVDAAFAPRVVQGAGLVLGNGAPQPEVANRVYLPSARNGYFELVEINFATPATAGLFGSRLELLQEWQTRLSAYRREGS